MFIHIERERERERDFLSRERKGEKVFGEKMQDSPEWTLPSTTYLETWKVIEQAKEELQILETQHPNRFNYLKDDLKSFIFSESQKLMLFQNNISSSSSTATTQASSSFRKRKRMKKDDDCEKVAKVKFQKDDRVEAVLERAQACLRKIKDLKTNFF